MCVCLSAAPACWRFSSLVNIYMTTSGAMSPKRFYRSLHHWYRGCLSVLITHGSPAYSYDLEVVADKPSISSAPYSHYATCHYPSRVLFPLALVGRCYSWRVRPVVLHCRLTYGVERVDIPSLHTSIFSTMKMEGLVDSKPSYSLPFRLSYFFSIRPYVYPEVFSVGESRFACGHGRGF